MTFLGDIIALQHKGEHSLQPELSEKRCLNTFR